MKSTKFYKYLTERLKLSLRNIRSGQEIWHIFASRLDMMLAALTLVVIVFVAVLTTVAYTSILDFIPGYPGNKSRRIIVENLNRLDSLEVKVREWERYSNNLALILEGNIVIPDGVDSAKTILKGSVAQRSASDASLRLQMETDSNYMLARDIHKKRAITFEMVAPARGAIVRPYNPTQGMFGVEIAPQPNQSVMSILDGTVILNSWSPQEGYMVVIEHAANMVSMYKKVNRPLCRTGQRVRSGEAIAITGTVDEGKIPHLVFELWNNGNAIDPENYITF